MKYEFRVKDKNVREEGKVEEIRRRKNVSLNYLSSCIFITISSHM